MLNGIDPVIIFQFSKNVVKSGSFVTAIPVLSETTETVLLPPIPIYLSEKLTGLLIESEDKQIEIETETQTKSDGTDPKHKQKGIANVVTINMIATRESLGLTLLIALTDLIVPKVTSKEYSITYAHGAIVVFDALLNSFSVTQNTNDDKLTIKIELSKTISKTPQAESVPVVAPIAGTVPL